MFQFESGIRSTRSRKGLELNRVGLEALERRTLLTAPSVTITSPLNATHSALVSTDISVTFDQSIKAESVSDQTVAVHRQQSGRLLSANGDFTSLVTSSDTVTINPANDFHPGELVQLTTTASIENAAMEAAVPHVWQFRAKVAGGTGLFSDSGQTLGSSNSRDVALGDVDGDGDLDAFVANIGQANRLWFNDGGGTFSDSGQVFGSSASVGVSLGDVDSDGDLDAFVANAFDQANRLWINDGNGTFADSGQALGSSDSREVGLVDVDGDGDMDAFITNNSFQPNRVWLNDGSGLFSDSGQGLGDSLSDEVAMGDVDGDGDLDAYVSNNVQPNRLWLNNGSGLFNDSGQTLGVFNRRDVALGDVNGDGALDAFVVNVFHNRVWLNDGSGTFNDTGQVLAGGPGQVVSLGDVDGDGDLDAFIGSVNTESNRVWLNNGVGEFTDSGQTLGSSTSEGAELGDLDGDGDLDVFVANDRHQPSANKVWLNEGTPNRPPSVGDQSFEIVENESAVGTVVASDVDLPDDVLTYSISGGPDAGQFTVSSATGALSFLSAPNYETPLDAGGNNVYDVTVTVTDSKSASDSGNIVVTVTNVTATISGTVFVDADGDGLFDGGTESAIDAVIIELLDGAGGPLDSDLTSMGGVYGFEVDDEFATYRIRETQPTGVDDGAAILGDANGNSITGEAVDGSVLSSNEMQLTLTGIDASDYDFTEVGDAVQAGDTATIGFWQNKNGQTLIKQGGAALVNWLNGNFGNIFGSTFTDGNGGDDDAEVARFYKNEFFKKKLKGTSKVDAQFMATALATFFTSSSLSGGSVAASYGFNVTDMGIGTNVVNVGSSGDAFGVADNTNVTIMALLLATNSLTGADDDGDASEDYSHVYDLDGDGVLSDAEKAMRAMANSLYTFINELGDI